MVPRVNDQDPIVELRANPEAQRYEAELADGSVAIMAYRPEKDRIAVTQTEVPTHYRKQGIAARLTEFGLDDAVSRGLAILPDCPYTAWYIERHPKYQDHVHESFGG